MGCFFIWGGELDKVKRLGLFILILLLAFPAYAQYTYYDYGDWEQIHPSLLMKWEWTSNDDYRLSIYNQFDHSIKYITFLITFYDKQDAQIYQDSIFIAGPIDPNRERNSEEYYVGSDLRRRVKKIEVRIQKLEFVR